MRQTLAPLFGSALQNTSQMKMNWIIHWVQMRLILVILLIMFEGSASSHGQGFRRIRIIFECGKIISDWKENFLSYVIRKPNWELWYDSNLKMFSIWTFGYTWKFLITAESFHANITYSEYSGHFGSLSCNACLSVLQNVLIKNGQINIITSKIVIIIING